MNTTSVQMGTQEVYKVRESDTVNIAGSKLKQIKSNLRLRSGRIWRKY